MSDKKSNSRSNAQANYVKDYNSLRNTVVRGLNRFGAKWNKFWSQPVQITYANGPHDVVGNGGLPHTTTNTLGQATALTAGAVAAPVLVMSAATALPETAAGLTVGAALDYAGHKGGEKIVELIGGDKNAQEAVGDIVGFSAGMFGGGMASKGVSAGRKAATNYVNKQISNYLNKAMPAEELMESVAEAAKPGRVTAQFQNPPRAKITEAERLGIPKGERNNTLRHLQKYAQEYDDIIRSGEITPEKERMLLYLVDLYYKHSTEFPIMSVEHPRYPRVFRHGSNSKFTVFDKSKFGATDGGFHGEAFYTSPTDFKIKNPKASIHGERVIFSMGSRPYQYSLYLRNPKPYTITSNHGEGFSWFNRYPEGAIITNNGAGYFHGKHFTETLFTNPRLAKFANAITYDDMGNIIPLRKRFDWTNPDMRYKSGGKLNYLNFFK